MKSFRNRLFVLLPCLFILNGLLARAQIVVWDGSTDQTWSQPDSTSWTGATYGSGDLAEFLGAGSGTITIDGGGVTPGSVLVNSSSDYTFTGGAITGSGTTLTKTGSGLLTLSNTNTYTGLTTIDDDGVIDVGTISDNAISNSSGIFLGDSANGGGILQGNGSFTRSLSGNATPGAGQVSAQRGGFAARGGDLTVNIGGSGAEFGLNTGGYIFGNNFMFGSTTADSKVIVVNPINVNSSGGRSMTVTAGIGGDEATSAELSGVLRNPTTLTSGTTQLRKEGDGMLILSNEANTFDGAFAIREGTVSITKIRSVGEGNSSLGAPSTADFGAVRLGDTTTTGRLRYTGTGDTTDRRIEMGGTTGGAILDQSGTGSLTFTTDLRVVVSGSKTLTLQGSTTGTGTFAGDIGDPGTGSLSLDKSGSGTWFLSGNNTYSGLTAVNEGVLDVGTFSDGALSSDSGLLLGSAVTASGDYAILQGNGSFTRSLGSNATPNSGQVASAAGGFAARGGLLTVDFGGAGAGISLNQGGFKFGNNFVFGSSMADNKVVLINPVNINSGGFNGTRRITVVAGIGGAEATSAEFRGVISDQSGSNPNGIQKLGDGLLVLSADNTYSGPTRLDAGMLQVGLGGNGRSGSGDFQISSGTTILGTGLIQTSSFVAGTGVVVHAGDGTAKGDFGTLSFIPAAGSGVFDFQAGSSLILGIDPLNPAGSDLLSFGGTSAHTITFAGNLTLLAPDLFVPSSTANFNVLVWNGLSTPTFGSQFTYSGLLYGNGDEDANNLGLDLPDIFGSGYAWDISSLTTDGSIALVSNVVPEPSRFLLLTTGLGLALLSRRRGRKA